MLTAFAALIIVIGAGSLWLVLADLSFLKPTVENYVRSITGRDFAIANSDWAAAERGTAITGGAAVITAGLSILAQAAWNRTARSKDPCGTALNHARSDTP